MITTAYVAGLLTTVCLVVLARLASEERPTEPSTQSDPEEDDRPWRRSWQLRTRKCLEELRGAQCSTERIEALQWARRLHVERRAHAYQDEEALRDAEAFWEEVNDLFRPWESG